ncbi:MAG: phosphate butyryltransferase [Bacteroidales bacterium]|jgi:phosphate butyryltransferase|nr:phosphate butyryltransferase [Bacteroidales bacterium]MCI2122319.1 phosphate butyryltransferase [Bacteroidales bacterium]MCI2145355.1 phosphate butyryltransferase [Bacteroidales bacterium]
MISNFKQIFELLKTKGKKKLVVAWGVDGHSINAVYQAAEMGFVEPTLVGDKKLIDEVCKRDKLDESVFNVIDNPAELPAVAQAVSIVKEGSADFLMKGLCSTDKFMHAILNKEKGLLPEKAVMSHVSVIENPMYHKLLIVSDMAVIPAPDLSQKKAMTKYCVNVAHTMGIETPKVAFIGCTEQMLPKIQSCVDAALLAKMCDRGQIRGCVGDGPLALDVAISEEAVKIKKLSSPVAGDADILLFPNIESCNVFYKTNSKLCPNVHQSGMVVGAKVPCVLSSRADSIDTKLNSIAIAALSA